MTVKRIETVEDAVVVIRTGVVTGSQNWSAPRIDARTTNRTDMVTGQTHSQTSVSSSASEELRLFIRGEDGIEFEGRATNLGFGVRDGHQVSMVYVGAKGGDHPAPVGFINHTTGNRRLFDRDVKRQIGGPTNALGGMLMFALMIIGPVVVWTVWSAVAVELRAEGQGANLGELFIRALGSLVVGVFGVMWLQGPVGALLRKIGLLPAAEPGLSERVLERIRAEMKAEEAEMRSAKAAS